MTERQRAFLDFFGEWAKMNALSKGTDEACVARLERARSAAAAGWNAALTWAAKQIGEKRHEG